MNIRFAKIEDLEQIVSIYNSTIASRMVTADTEEITVESRVAWFNAHSSDLRPIWVMEDNVSILGWISFEPFNTRSAYDKTVEISIYVKEKARGKRVGVSLIENAFNECKRLNIHTLTALVFGHNEPSCKMVEKLGFEKWGFLPNIASFEDGERDLVIYGKRIQ